MALTLTIAGSIVKAPSSCEIQVIDIVSEAKRTVGGNLSCTRLNTKRKLVCKWNLLTAAEWTQILNLIATTFFFSITYTDPLTNGYVTKTVYAGDRKAESIFWFDSTPHYQNAEISFIEQ